MDVYLSGAFRSTKTRLYESQTDIMLQLGGLQLPSEAAGI